MRNNTVLPLALLAAMFITEGAMAQDNSKKTALPDPAKISWRKDRKVAKKQIKKGNIETAISYLEAGAMKKPKKAYFPQTLSAAELQLRDYKSSNKWYKLLVDADTAKHKHPEYIFQYALTQKYLGQYEDAIANFNAYKKLAKDDEASAELKKRATREAEGARLGIRYRDSVPKPAYKVMHLNENINQPLADFSPIEHHGSLYFGALKEETYVEEKGKMKLSSFSKIYESKADGKNWLAATALNENINGAKVHTGDPTFTTDGNTMYYTACAQDETAKMKCMLMRSNLVNGSWEKGISAGTVNDPLYSNTQPAVGKNKDGEDVVYFVSDRNPGKGLDIFYSKINADGSLGKPRSVGPQINSKGDEQSPFFEPKTNTLYFSSNGWITIGGQDVFKTSFDNGGEWTEPENMGMPVNSSADDVFFSINDKNTQGFVVSNRAGGFGTKSETCCDDIYAVHTTKVFLAVRGAVYHEVNENRQIADQGLVTLYDDRNGIELNSYNLISGRYFFDLEPERGYKLVSRKDGFRESVLPFTTDGKTETDTFQFDLFLKRKEEPIMGRIVGRIFYDYDKSKLREDARDSLKHIDEFLTQNPQYVVEVGGHTDGKGKDSYNGQLAKRRSESVINYFIYERKMRPERFVVKAYGGSQPLAPNTNADGSDNPTGRAMNRRTEFKVIDELKFSELKKDSVAIIKEKRNGKEYKPTEKEKVKRTVTSTKSEAPAKTTSETTPPANDKKDEPVMAKASVKSAEAKPVKKEVRAKPVPASEGYAEAPAKPFTVKGKVFTEKGGKRLAASEGIVFLSKEDGSEQKTFYLKADGAYYFDMSRASTGAYKLVARKGTAESAATVINLDAQKASNNALDLVIPQK
ncbi:MAG: OmpA family protein [Chitinophagales bacterium]